MSGYVNPVFRPDFTDYPASPQNRLASGFNAIWPASNPVGTETTQGMQSATPVDQVAFMRPDGTPVMQSDMAAAHQQVQTAMQTAPTMVLGMMGTTDPAGIRAYHGSPYDFERFDASKIGAGEGAQAYGHGLYFAEKEGTARSYRDQLATAQTPEETAAWYLHEAGGDRNAAIAQMTDHAVNGGIGATAEQAANIRNGLQLLKGGADIQPAAPGKMYEVNIRADPEQFLHWDKPLSEQHPGVQAAFKRIGYEGGTDAAGNPMSGGDIYRSFGDPAAAASTLQRAGIPGIRYLDQGSRGAGQGTHNYVVFDAATIDILRKYGLAGLGIGLGATAAGTQQQSQ